MDFVPPEALLESLPGPLRDVAERLRGVIQRAVPDAIEAVRPGWRLIGYDVPVGRRTAYFAYVAPEAVHVHLGFEYGVLMDDPLGVLQGRGVTRRVRWLTFLPGDPLDPSVLDGLVREAARIARLSRSERLARALDLEAHERPGASAGQLRDPRDRSGAATLGPMRFRTIVQLEGKTATGFSVPPAIVEALGQGQRPPVRVTIGDHTYRSTIAPYRGVFMLPLSAENREAAGVAAGDEVDVDVELDREPREVTVPPDLAAALEGDAAARRFFDGLSYSNRRRFVLSIEGARTADTRRRRIDRTVDQLRDGRI